MTVADLEDGCRLAADYGVASVCIKPFAVALAAKLLDGTVVNVGTTIGFPHGGHASSLKILEARQAIDDGAIELDMVVNIGQVIGGDWSAVRDDIAGVVQLAHDHKSIVKVIFENCYLNDDQKARLCQICGEVKADYVKTSTGYGTGDHRLHRARLRPPGPEPDGRYPRRLARNAGRAEARALDPGFTWNGGCRKYFVLRNECWRVTSSPRFSVRSPEVADRRRAA
jgi:deoxyribose-phosphate aldolase